MCAEMVAGASKCPVKEEKKADAAKAESKDAAPAEEKKEEAAPAEAAAIQVKKN
tara:strand:+ start:698 stop:859 length:162 start_codon:yes stop_codon:yes gene_type:complete